MNSRAITAAALAAAVLFHSQGFAQTAVSSGAGATPAAAADPDAAAHAIWHSFVVKNPPTEKGCFHVSYPNYAWEGVDCKETQTRVHSVHPQAATDAPLVAGNGKDYAAEAQGLISSAHAALSLSNVTSVTSVGVAAFDNQGILGPNEYSLQLNTNNGSKTSACAGISNCTVWQQFVYATDYNTTGEAALFMQYWLLDWGSSTCPEGWHSYPNVSPTDCYMNSKSVSLPDIPVTQLGDVVVNAGATPGGNDVLMLDYAVAHLIEVWAISAEDSILDIGSVWNAAEYNVVGDSGGSQAQFNYLSSINVQLSIVDESTFAPVCFSNAGTTGETNNLNLGTCQVGVSTDPYIQFNEALIDSVIIFR